MGIGEPKFDKLPQETPDLSAHDKSALAHSWTEMIVSGVEVPSDIQESDPSRLKDWLIETLGDDTQRLIEEWGLKTDQDVVLRIRQESDSEKKSGLALEYIMAIHSQVDTLTHGFDKSGRKSTRWDSWPRIMRETKEFNCVGATLLGERLLSAAGIESYCGNPVGHVVNIVRLPNNDWWYVDFRNGKGSVLKIEAEEAELSGVRVLKINHPRLDCRVIPLFDRGELPGVVLDNVSALKQEAMDPKIPDDSPGKNEAVLYMKRFSDDFARTDFSRLHETLYPQLTEILETPEMQEEVVRLDLVEMADRAIKQLGVHIPEEKREALLAEVRTRLDDIRRFFAEDDSVVLEGVSEDLRRVLELYGRGLAKLREERPEMHRLVIERLTSLLSTL